MTTLHLTNHFEKPLRFLVYASFCAALSMTLAACKQTPNPQGNLESPIRYTTLTGKSFDSASLKGTVTLVNFWATSCTTCVQEMPMMVRQFKTYAPQGYRHVAVAMDYDPAAFVQQFTTERALPFDVVHDANGKIAKAFGNVKLTPTSFLIDKQGNITKRYVGAPKETELKSAIERLLAES